MAKKTLSKSLNIDQKVLAAVLVLAAILGFIIYSSQAANRDEFGGGDDGPKPLKVYRYNTKGIKHDKGEATEDPDWRQLVWRSSGDPADGEGYSWRGPNVTQKRGSYLVCFYTEKEEGDENNAIYYDVRGKKVITAYEGPTSYDWMRKRYWRDCLKYKLTRETKVQFRAIAMNGIFDIAQVEVYKGNAVPYNADVLNEQ